MAQFTKAELEQLKRAQERDPGAGLPPSTTPVQRREDEVIQELSTKAQGQAPDDLTPEELQQLQMAQQRDPGADEPRHYKEWEVLPNMINNLPISTAKLVGNMANAFTHPVDTLNGLTDIAGGVPLMVMPEDWRNNITKDNPYAQRMLHGAQAMWQDKVDHYGDKQAIVDTVAGDPAYVAADLATFGSMVPGAARAAAAVNPINWAKVVPEVIGKKTGATAAAAKSADKILDTFIVPENLNPFSGKFKVTAPGPTKTVLNRLILDEAEKPAEVLTALQNAPNLGRKYNAAQATANEVDATRFHALQRAADDVLPTQKRELRETQNIERLADIRQIGRNHSLTDDQILRAGGGIDPATASIDDLERALDAADAANYGPVDAAMVRADDALIEMLDSPVMQDVFNEARLSAANARRDFQIGENAPAVAPSSTPSGLYDAHGRPIMTTVPGSPATYATYPGQNLSFIKKAFDDLTSARTKEFGAGSAKVRDIQTARDAFISWLEDPTRLPQHRTAREDHAAWSRLIDRRRAGEVFEDALTGALEGEDIATHRAAAYGNLLDSPRNAVKRNAHVGKASGFNYDNWNEFLTPEDLAILERNRADLARLAQAESQAKDAAKYRGELNNSAEAPKAPSLLNYKVTVLNMLSDMFTGGVKGRVRNELAAAMQTPEATAALLEDAMVRKAQMGRFYGHVNRGRKAVHEVNKRPAVYNALDADRRDQEKRRNHLR